MAYKRSGVRVSLSPPIHIEVIMSRNWPPERESLEFQDRFWDRARPIPELAWDDRIRLPSSFAIRQMTALDFLNMPHQAYPRVDN